MPSSQRFRDVILPGLVVAALVGTGLMYSFSTGAEPIHAEDLPEGMVLVQPVVSDEIPGTLRTLNERISKDVKPQDNAVVWLVHLYGEDAFEPELHDVSMEMLGIEKMSPASPLFVSLVEFAKTLDGVPADKVDLQAAMLQEQLFEAGVQVWSKTDNPQLAEYLAVNTEALKTLTHASEKPAYFAPMLAPELPSRLMAASLVIERRLPFLARMLTARALLRLGENDVTGCTSDLMTCHRIASLLASGSPFDVSLAKAQVIDALAFQAERTMLESGRLNAEQLAELRKAFAQIPPMPPAALAADVGERAIIHQEIELLETDEDSRIGFFEDAEHQKEDASQIKSLDKTDWKLAVQRADEVHDLIVQALRTKDRNAQNELFQKLDEAYAQWEATVDQKTEDFSKAIQKDVPGMSRWIGENMAMSLRPIYRQRRFAEDRDAVRRSIIAVGLALESYQREHGKFPEKLEQLVPEYLDAVPVDAATDKPFSYTVEGEDRARLVSLGTNQMDDAGQFYNDDVILNLK
ncbi:hypothetical protein SH661x_004704 [Planctomicrobium sp. SH661]|uniref:hypothetical protein n=1 Tax=Planctomicrobium sp. SH661 TaxID=3448124 RepID=UPI003F5AFEA3